ncbi:RsmE family RNA methyltransferase, partial [Flavobacteriales bacterium]|nr:RsmE family RNA methyltransferase [Flavobacteriales bacterium]
PIICDRSERKILKVERLQKIVTSAAKQSKNFNFPELKAPISFKSFIAKETTGNKYIAHCEDESSKKELYEMGLSKNAEVLILIGPEGDFTPKEIELASSNGFEELSLGESRLRTETAGIVATTLYHTLK